VTDSTGSYTIALGCRVHLRFSKSGYNSKLMTWPSDLSDPNCQICPTLHPVKLNRVQKGK
jgi:hypothetical protein